jgi:hypothetical protein
MPNISAGTRRDEAIRKLEPARDERYKWLAPFGPVRATPTSKSARGARPVRPRIPSLFKEQLTWFAKDVMRRARA